jgi:hypothetical protein
MAQQREALAGVVRGRQFLSEFSFRRHLRE